MEGVEVKITADVDPFRLHLARIRRAAARWGPVPYKRNVVRYPRRRRS